MSTESKSRIEIKQIALKNLIPTQGKLKERSAQEKRKITASLAENEMLYPLYAAEIDGKYQLIDGHFRREVLTEKYGEDHEMPVVVFHDMTLEEAKKQCLVLSATYGGFTNISEWLKMELPALDHKVLENLNMPLPNLDVDANVTRRLEQTLNKCPICGQ